ncbi:MAG: HD domain-containing protein [Zoogloea sp.]|nr:HD domain-containing protein [Zoogloea sp.]
MTDPNPNTSQSCQLECLARQLEAAEQERANALSLLERARAELARTQGERDRAVNALIGLRKETFFNLARDAERRDGESPMHTVRIGAYASLIATSLGCTPAWSEMLETAAQMHDIGKIGIHDSILSKTGPLTTEEWRIMREHPTWCRHHRPVRGTAASGRRDRHDPPRALQRCWLSPGPVRQ